ncbi:MAG: preprotein translocase subunit SecG [Limnohabitans sp.]|nr:preprotein translocase subunit SecG [Limnohabitans sp.]
MSTLLNLLLLVQILSALAMIGLILVQHGKGADMGVAFGSGISGSLFGATGGANFLSRTTSVLAVVFFVCTLALAYFGNLRATVDTGSLLERTAVPVSAAVTAGDKIPGSAGTAPDAAADKSVPNPVPAAPASTPAPAAPAGSPASQIPAK